MGAGVPMHKVVLRYKDGRTVKGKLLSFQQSQPFLTIDEDMGGVTETARVEDLKAVFYVKDYEGAPTYHEQKIFRTEGGYGKKTIVRFIDGEELWGYTQGYAPNREGFFLFPSDGASNNSRIFVVNDAVKEVRFPEDEFAYRKAV